MVDISRMTDRTRRVLQIAEDEARRREATAIFPEHLLLGSLLEGAGVAAHVLKRLGVTISAMQSCLPQAHDDAEVSPEPMSWGPSIDQVVDRAFNEATLLKHNYIGTEHLVLGVIFAGGDAVATILDRLDVKAEAIHQEVYELLGHGHDYPDRAAAIRGEPVD